MRSARLLLAFFFLFSAVYSASGQLTLQLTSSPALCPSTGSITATVSNGAPNYTYTISANTTCLPATIPPAVTASNTYTFSNLRGACTFTVTVSSQNGQQASQTVTVADSYPPMLAPTLVPVMGSKLSCSYMRATAFGGRAPYVYTFYQGGSATNPAAIVQTGSSNILQLATLSTGLYTVKVSDNCNTERVVSAATTNFITPDVFIIDSWRPACNEFRLKLFPDSFPAGVIVNILDKNGNPISGTTTATGFTYTYPYTLPDTVFTANHPWGLSNVTPRPAFHRFDVPVPNNPSLFPITVRLTGTDACQHVDNEVFQYPFPAASTAYPAVVNYTENCNGTICALLDILRDGQQLENHSYPISLATAQAGPYTLLGSTTNFQYNLCNLQPNTQYWMRTTDPCTARDTSVGFLTPPLTPFAASATIISYCVNPVSPAYLATVRFDYQYLNGNNVVQMVSGPGAPQTYNGVLVSGLDPGNYVFRLFDNCGIRSQDINLTVAGTYSANISAGYTISPTCVTNCIKVTATGTASGTLVPNGPIANYFTRMLTISGSTPPPPPQLHTGVVTFCVPLPGRYVFQTSPFFAGITCLTPISDTIDVPAYTLPVIDRLYNIRCAALNNIAVPLPPNSDTGFVFTLLNSSNTIVAGPQSVNGNPSTNPPTNAHPSPNIFSNIPGNAGEVFYVRISDRCGNSATSPVTLNTDLVITGSVKCGVASGGQVVTDTLRADLIPGAMYTWTSPGGTTYGPSNNPNYNSVPAENGIWELDASVTFNGCTVTFHNEFTVSCSVLPVSYASINLQPRKCGALLSWTTARESNTSRFRIEAASSSNGSYKEAGSVPAAGNSNTAKNYAFTLTLTPGTHYVRIRQVDTDGHSSLSEVYKVNVNCAFAGVRILPNPVRRTEPTVVELNSAIAEPVDFTLTDAAGRAVWRKRYLLAEGMNLLQIPPSSFAAGHYFLKISSRSGINTQTLSLLIKP